MPLGVITRLTNNWKRGMRKAAMKIISWRWQVVWYVWRYLQGIAATSMPVISLQKCCPLQQGSFQPHFVNCFPSGFQYLHFSFCCTLECFILAGKQSSEVICGLCMFSLWFGAVKVLHGPNDSCFCISQGNHMNFHLKLELVWTLSECLRLWKREGWWLWGAIYCVLCAKYIHPTLFPASEPLALGLLMVVLHFCCMLVYLCLQWYNYTELMMCITVSVVEFSFKKAFGMTS